MIAYQPVDPASSIDATRLTLAQLTGRFLCRRVRSSFGHAALCDLLAECRNVACVCSGRFDAQILTVEKLTRDVAEVVRFAQCPQCQASRQDRLQFRRDGLILAHEDGAWFVWLGRVHPNRYGNAMEEHLFWHEVDWTRSNDELAEDLNVPDETVRAWRRKVGKPRANATTDARSRPAQAASRRARAARGSNPLI